MRSPQAGGPPNSMSMSRDYRQMYNDDSRHRDSADKEYVESDSNVYHVETLEKLNSFDLREPDTYYGTVEIHENHEIHENNEDHEFHEIREGNKLVSFQSEKSEKTKIEFPYFTDEDDQLSDFDDQNGKL